MTTAAQTKAAEDDERLKKEVRDLMQAGVASADTPDLVIRQAARAYAYDIGFEDMQAAYERIMRLERRLARLEEKR